jgi:hypothetical protein
MAEAKGSLPRNTTAPARALLGKSNVRDQELLIHVPWEGDRTEGKLNVLADVERLHFKNILSEMICRGKMKSRTALVRPIRVLDIHFQRQLPL